jgi:hypothetical protein
MNNNHLCIYAGAKSKGGATGEHRLCITRAVRNRCRSDGDAAHRSPRSCSTRKMLSNPKPLASRDACPLTRSTHPKLMRALCLIMGKFDTPHWPPAELIVSPVAAAFWASRALTCRIYARGGRDRGKNSALCKKLPKIKEKILQSFFFCFWCIKN